MTISMGGRDPTPIQTRDLTLDSSIVKLTSASCEWKTSVALNHAPTSIFTFMHSWLFSISELPLG